MSFVLKSVPMETFTKFLSKSPGHSFLQNESFGRWRTTLNETIFYLGVYYHEELQAVTLVQKIQTKLKTFCHVPHGITLKSDLSEKESSEVWDFFLKRYSIFGRTQKCDFVRISPSVQIGDTRFGQALKKQKYRPAPIHLVNPELSWKLDITKSEDELLAGMKKSTRYEVKKSQKPETRLTVQSGRSVEELDIFWQLHEATVGRQGFVPFTKNSTAKELEIFGDQAMIFNVFDEEVALASGLFLFDDTQAYYHQGASIRHPKPVAYAYIWAAILEAKKRGCTWFNFWGICAPENQYHPWAGLSKFKRGFGGEVEELYHVHDFPLTHKYWINWALESWRKRRRSY